MKAKTVKVFLFINGGFQWEVYATSKTAAVERMKLNLKKMSAHSGCHKYPPLSQFQMVQVDEFPVDWANEL
jgi:hypothetical protein